MKGRNSLKYLGYALSIAGFCISCLIDYITEEDIKNDMREYIDSKLGQ